MSSESDNHAPDGTPAAEVAVGANSILERIQRRRDEVSDTIKIDIPSWGGDLQAEYKVVHRIELEKMVKRIQKATSSAKGQQIDLSKGDADFLVKACVGVYAYDSETDEEVRVADGYELGLSKRLGDPPGTETIHGLVMYLFKFNGIAVASHAIKVARWMQDTSRVPVDDPQ